jgi:hypothetical protein
MSSPWDRHQEMQDIPVIERTLLVRYPNGRMTAVNRFDYNLAICTGGDKFIQCVDTGHIQAKRLAPLNAAEQAAFVARNDRPTYEDWIIELRGVPLVQA